MSTTTWFPGKRSRLRKAGLVLVAGGLLIAGGFGIWTLFTMNAKPIVLSGKVQTANGKAVAMARIYFTKSPISLPDITALTDAQGTFSVSVPVEGAYQIGCKTDGFAPVTVDVNVKKDQNNAITIRLP